MRIELLQGFFSAAKWDFFEQHWDSWSHVSQWYLAGSTTLPCEKTGRRARNNFLSIRGLILQLCSLHANGGNYYFSFPCFFLFRKILSQHLKWRQWGYSTVASKPTTKMHDTILPECKGCKPKFSNDSLSFGSKVVRSYPKLYFFNCITQFFITPETWN